MLGYVLVMSDRKALARAIAARTPPRFIEIKKEKRDRRPIVLGPNEMRLVEKERERLLSRLLRANLHHVPIQNLNALLFIGVFPALWLLAAVLDRILPSNSGHYSPREERRRQAERDPL